MTVDAEDAGQDTGGTLITDGMAIRKKEYGLPTAATWTIWAFTIAPWGAEAAELTAQLVCNQGNTNASVILHRSVLGGLKLAPLIGRLVISRSIIGEDRAADGGVPATLVIGAQGMDADISGSTIFGRATLRSIEAENSLLLGRIDLKHKQAGCVRFLLCPARGRSATPLSLRPARGRSRKHAPPSFRRPASRIKALPGSA